jgi:hypothetical protein
MKDDLDFAAMSWQGFRPPRSYAIVIVYVEFCIWCMEANRQTIERVASGSAEGAVSDHGPYSDSTTCRFIPALSGLPVNWE